MFWVQLLYRQKNTVDWALAQQSQSRHDNFICICHILRVLCWAKAQPTLYYLSMRELHPMFFLHVALS